MTTSSSQSPPLPEHAAEVGIGGGAAVGVRGRGPAVQVLRRGDPVVLVHQDGRRARAEARDTDQSRTRHRPQDPLPHAVILQRSGFGPDGNRDPAGPLLRARASPQEPIPSVGPPHAGDLEAARARRRPETPRARRAGASGSRGASRQRRGLGDLLQLRAARSGRGSRAGTPGRVALRRRARRGHVRAGRPARTAGPRAAPGSSARAGDRPR